MTMCETSEILDSVREKLISSVLFALDAVDPEVLIKDRLGLENDGRTLVVHWNPNDPGSDSRIDLGRFERIHILGAGKAAPFMFDGLSGVLGNSIVKEKIFGGVIISIEEHVRSRSGEYVGGRNEEHGKRRKKEYVRDRNEEHARDRNERNTGGRNEEYVGGRKEEHGKRRKKEYVRDRNEEHARDRNERNTVGRNEEYVGGRKEEHARGKNEEWGGVAFLPGSHPIPDERSVRAGETMVNYVNDNVRDNDLVIFLISGGASALLELPRPDHDLSDIGEKTKRLIRSGTDIHYINEERKRFSAIKGGKLGEMIHPARIITLALSDVPGSHPASIGSGPTITDDTNDLVVILGDNERFLDRACERISTCGLGCAIATTDDSGDVLARAKEMVDLLYEKCDEGMPSNEKKIGNVFLSGGELTVTVTGNGKGGRNQEFILAMLVEHERRRVHMEHMVEKWQVGRHGKKGGEEEKIDTPFFIASIASDGIDGPTDAGGAWADHTTWGKAMKIGLDPVRFLDENDSYHFFEKLGQLIITGPTRTNVMDLRLIAF